MSDTALKHIQHLSVTIGPRGSATPREREAHKYCRQVYEGLGYQTHWEEYMAGTSGWQPYALASGLTLAAEAIFWFAGGDANRQAVALGAAALSLFVTVAVLLQITFRENPLNWFLPAAQSQNVYAVARPAGEAKRRVVLSGHVDTHRAPLAFQSRPLFQFFQLLTTLGTASFIASTAIFAAGIFAADHALLRTISLIPTVIVAVVFLFTVQPDFTPFVPGANDNASGAAAVMALAERARREPFANTEIYFLNTGCEETGCWGMAAFLKAHPELADADYLILDSIAGRGAKPSYLRREKLLLPMKADAKLAALADALLKAHPEWKGYPYQLDGLFGEMSIVTRAGRRAITFLNFRKDGVLPDWHRPTDTFDRVNAELVDQTEQFVWEMLKRLDNL